MNENEQEFQDMEEKLYGMQRYCRDLEEKHEHRESVLQEKLNKKISANDDLLNRLEEMEEQYEKIQEMLDIVQSDNENLAEEREMLLDELTISMNGIKELKKLIRTNEKEFSSLETNLKENFQQFDDF